jgi:hypothetical protein
MLIACASNAKKEAEVRDASPIAEVALRREESFMIVMD